MIRCAAQTLTRVNVAAGQHHNHCSAQKPLITRYPIVIFAVIIGIASESLNDWADEQAGIEAVQRILDSLDDIHAMQDPYVDNDVYRGMLTDRRLASLLKVCHICTPPLPAPTSFFSAPALTTPFTCNQSLCTIASPLPCVVCPLRNSFMIASVVRWCLRRARPPATA